MSRRGKGQKPQPGRGEPRPRRERRDRRDRRDRRGGAPRLPAGIDQLEGRNVVFEALKRKRRAVHRIFLDERARPNPKLSMVLELAERAVVDGDVYYNLIEMAVGAKVNGGLRHTSNVADDLAAKREARAAETVPGPTSS